MQKAIEVLMSEHRLIEQVLGSLETFTSEVEGGLAPERAVLADYGAVAFGSPLRCERRLVGVESAALSASRMSNERSAGELHPRID